MTEEGQPRPCPVCGIEMEVQSIRDVEIDMCADHGIWLDNGELQQLIDLKSASTKGKIIQRSPRIRRARRRRAERKANERRSDLGGLQFLFFE